MANRPMTIEEIKDKKVEVEKAILGLIKKYEEETETRVTYINLRSDDGDDVWSTPHDNIKKRKSKGVQDVTLNTTMDNDVRSIDR